MSGGALSMSIPPPAPAVSPLAELGWVDPGWTNASIVVVATTLTATILLAGSARVRRRSQSPVGFLLPAIVIALVLPPGPATTGVSAVCLGLHAVGHWLLLVGQRQLRPRWLGAVPLLFAAWLGVSGLPWIGLAVSLAALGAMMGVRGPGRASHVFTSASALSVAILGLCIVSMAQRSLLVVHPNTFWVPRFASWGTGVAVAMGLLLTSVRLDWRTAVAAATATGAGVWWWPEHPNLDPLILDVPRLHYPHVPLDRVGSFMPRVHRNDPASVLATLPETDRHVVVSAPIPEFPLRRQLGLLIFLDWQDSLGWGLPWWYQPEHYGHSVEAGPRDLRGTVGDVISGCPSPCFIRPPPE